MEKFSLRSVLRSKKNPVEIFSKDKKNIEYGTAKKYVHHAEIHHKNKVKKVKLVERENINVGGLKISEKWKILKGIGFPVVPTLRETDDGRVFMTDLKADGSELFGKSLAYELQNILLFPPPRTTLKAFEGMKNKENFLKIVNDKEEFRKIEEKVKKYKKLANESKIRLPVDDAFELVVHPDGTWDLVILDVESALSTNPYLSDTRSTNRVAASSFLDNLLAIKDSFFRLNNIYGKIK